MMPTRFEWLTGLALAIVSGLLTWPLSTAGQWLANEWPLPAWIKGVDWSTILVGLGFAVFILLPMMRVLSQRWIRALGLALLSVLIYSLNTRLVIHDFWIDGMNTTVSLILAAGIGGLLVALSMSFLGGRGWHLRGWITPTLAGLLGGIPFAWGIQQVSDWLATGAFVVWQVSIYCSLLWTERPERR